MEWVETTGRTIDEAKNRALDQLGVAEDDAEFDVLDEPRAGLFGRVRGEARVRARVRPTQPRPKLERRDRKKKAGDPSIAASTQAATPTGPGEVGQPGASTSDRPRLRDRPSGSTRRRSSTSANTGADAGASAAPRVASENPGNDDDKETMVDAQQVGDEAQRFVQGLVDAFGVAGTASVRRDGDDIEVVVEGSDLGLLVGPRGATLQAVQELARVASQRRLGDHDTRLRVDIAGYRERRREALGRFAQQVAAQVVAEQAPKRLEPMSSADRKVIHDALADVAGVVTRSAGDDPHRCVIIEPANA